MQAKYRYIEIGRCMNDQVDRYVLLYKYTLL